MAVKCAVVTGTITGSGSTDFESAGFGTPDAAIVFLSLANTTSNPSPTARPCIGFWDGTTQYSVATNSGDSIPSSDTYGLAAAYAAQLYVDRLWSISNISGGNGVRLSWVSGAAVTVNLYVTVVLLGGLTNKKVGVQDLGTGTSAINVTAPNFRADLVFLATIVKDGTGTRDGARLAFGAAHLNSSDVASQGSVSYYSEDAQGSMKTGCLVRDNKALAVSANDAEAWNISVSAYSTGFTLTPSSSAANADAYYLAIELPDPDDAHVVVDVAATSTGDDAYTGAGFEPVVLLLAGGVTSSVNTVTQEGAIWFGAGTESAQRSIAICDEDAQGDADTENYCATDKILHIRLDTGVADAEATLSSFDADGWTLNYSDAASSAWKYLAIAIGASTGGATHALEGAALVVGSASGAITTGIPLAGSAAVVSSATGAITTGIPLAGTAAAAAAASGTITTQITLSGTALAQALANAGLTTAIQLAGAATAQATASGDLSSGALLAGAAVAQALASGDITTAIRLAGAAQAQAGASGALGAGVALSGAAVAEALASATLTTQIQLSGAALVQAFGSGALSTAVQLAGAAAGQASASGSLAGGAAALAGAAAVQALASGTLTTEIPLSGAALAQALASGTLTVGFTLEGAALVQALASGSLTTGIRLAGVAVGTATATGTLWSRPPAQGGQVLRAPRRARILRAPVRALILRAPARCCA